MSNLIPLLLLTLFLNPLTPSNWVKTVQRDTDQSSTKTILLTQQPSSYNYDDNDNVRGPKRGAGRQDR